MSATNSGVYCSGETLKSMTRSFLKSLAEIYLMNEMKAGSEQAEDFMAHGHDTTGYLASAAVSMKDEYCSAFEKGKILRMPSFIFVYEWFTDLQYITALLHAREALVSESIFEGNVTEV